MLFCLSGSQKTEQFSLYLNDRVIKIIDQFKYLEVILGENLSFHEYLKTMSLNISRKIGIISPLRHFFPRDVLKTIYIFFLIHNFFIVFMFSFNI